MQKQYVANWHISHDNRLIEPGETVTLDEAVAQGLGAAVTLASDEASPKKQAKKDAAQ